MDELLVVIDDARCEVIEASKAIAAALTGPPHPTLQTQLDTIQRLLAEPPDTGIPAQLDEVLALLTAPKPRRRVPYYVWPAAVVLAGVLGLAGGWTSARCPREVRTEATLMRHIDVVLTTHYNALPPAVQTGIAQVYKQANFQDPSQRKKDKKWKVFQRC